MTLAPGIQRAVTQMQALIDAAPKHPLYDVVINLEAARGPEIVIGWRGKVQWTPKEHRRRTMDMLEVFKYTTTSLPTYGGPEQPVWGNDITTSVFMFEADPESVFHAVMKMIDMNFLRTLENTCIADNKWTWTRGARFA